MRIAIFSDAYFPRVNGVSISIKSYAESLAVMGHEIYIFCPEYELKKTFFQKLKNKIRFDDKASSVSGVKVVRLSSDAFPISREDRATRIDQWRELKKLLDDFKPDVIHLNTEFSVGWLGLTYSRARHVPLVYTFHTMWEDYFANYVHVLPSQTLKAVGRQLVKFYLKRADKVIVPTDLIRQVAVGYGYEREIFVIPTGISRDAIVSGEELIKKAENALDEISPEIRRNRILLYAGRIVKEKNLYFLLDVLEEVRKEIPDAVLVFAGDGPIAGDLKKAVQMRNLENSVFFTGYLNREVLGGLYHTADIFVFPSITETQGLVTVEAMLNGAPVVAIGKLGTAAIMQGDNGGYMVDESIENFSSRCIQLLKDSTLRSEKSAEAKKWGSQWSMDVLAPKMLECYRKAVADKAKKK